MVARERFEKIMEEISIPIEGEDYLLFSIYCGALQEWNQKMNLTAITDDEGIAVKHFADSLLPLTLFDIPANARLVDVGTGAGFPSIPMKLIRRDLQLTLLDSLEKRLGFLRYLCGRLGIDAATLHARAEEAGRDPRYRERYDVATSRAVASLGTLAEYCLPLVRTGGVMLALKGSGGEEEAREGRAAVELCGGRIRDILRYQLPGGDSRTLVVVEKISQTPTKYPRPSAQISKRPL